MQILTVSSVGEPSVIPENRTLTVRFANIPEGEVRVYKNGGLMKTEESYADCAAVRIPFESGATYRIEVAFKPQSKLEKLHRRATDVLIRANADNEKKVAFWKNLMKAESVEEYLKEIEASSLDESIKLRLKETL